MCRAKSGRNDGGLRAERNDSDRNAFEQVENSLDLLVAATRWAHETLGERRGCHGEPVAAAKSVGEHISRCCMVGVVAVEEADDDARVEVD